MAQALWGAAAIGYPDGMMKMLRTMAVRSFGKLCPGSRTGIKLASFMATPSQDPAKQHHAQVVENWASAVWTPDMPWEQVEAAFVGSLRKLAAAANPWQVAAGPAAVYLMVLQRLGWYPVSFREVIVHNGLHIKLLELAPKALRPLAHEATQRWSDFQDTASTGLGTPPFAIFWPALAPLLRGPCKRHGWTLRHLQALRYILAGGEWN